MMGLLPALTKDNAGGSALANSHAYSLNSPSVYQ